MDLKSIVEVYVEASTAKNRLSHLISCMLKKDSGNYGKNFQFKVTSIADKSQVTPSTGNYRRGEGCNLFDLRPEFTYRYEMQ